MPVIALLSSQLVLTEIHTMLGLWLLAQKRLFIYEAIHKIEEFRARRIDNCHLKVTSEGQMVLEQLVDSSRGTLLRDETPMSRRYRVRNGPMSQLQLRYMGSSAAVSTASFGFGESHRAPATAKDRDGRSWHRREMKLPHRSRYEVSRASGSARGSSSCLVPTRIKSAPPVVVSSSGSGRSSLSLQEEIHNGDGREEPSAPVNWEPREWKL
eukprot:1303886-Prymnesium_polylepis.1